MDYLTIFEKLWEDYQSTNPSVDKIQKLLSDRGETVVNDHVAFRTYDLPGINLEELAKPFLSVGYVEKGNYHFEEKKLNAKHFEHASAPDAPKVFISELITNKFSPLVIETAKWVARQVKKNQLSDIDLVYSKRCWEPINYASYEALRKESEYAAWVYVYGYCANHFTVSVNHLKTIDSIEDLNSILRENGFLLNDSGGEIKGSEKEFLKQSSIMADKIPVKFASGTYEIPCCYYEFAERFTQPDGDLFNGFIAKSADKIFESTNNQTY